MLYIRQDKEGAHAIFIYYIKHFMIADFNSALRHNPDLDLNYPDSIGWTPICYALAYKQSFFRNLPSFDRHRDGPEVPDKDPRGMIWELLLRGAEVPDPNMKDREGVKLRRLVDVRVLRFMEEKKLWERREDGKGGVRWEKVDKIGPLVAWGADFRVGPR